MFQRDTMFGPRAATELTQVKKMGNKKTASPPHLRTSRSKIQARRRSAETRSTVTFGPSKRTRRSKLDLARLPRRARRRRGCMGMGVVVPRVGGWVGVCRLAGACMPVCHLAKGREVKGSGRGGGGFRGRAGCCCGDLPSPVPRRREHGSNRGPLTAEVWVCAMAMAMRREALSIRLFVGCHACNIHVGRGGCGRWLAVKS
ncbi:hypothetical protein HDK64DRAFT_14973 [Phyllosticta capitalensis]